MEATLEQLVELACSGDRVAMDRLWQSQRRFAATVMLAHLPRSVEMEDLLQDVAIKLVTEIHRLQSPAAFRPWLRTVARNVALSQGRRARVRDQQTLTLEAEPVDPACAAAGRSQQIDEQLDQILAIAHNLHVDYREPLLMRAVEGMSQKAIAAALELPETTVETRLARARSLLRAEAGRLREREAPCKPVNSRTQA